MRRAPWSARHPGEVAPNVNVARCHNCRTNRRRRLVCAEPRPLQRAMDLISHPAGLPSRVVPCQLEVVPQPARHSARQFGRAASKIAKASSNDSAPRSFNALSIARLAACRGPSSGSPPRRPNRPRDIIEGCSGEQRNLELRQVCGEATWDRVGWRAGHRTIQAGHGPSCASKLHGLSGSRGPRCDERRLAYILVRTLRRLRRRSGRHRVFHSRHGRA